MTQASAATDLRTNVSISLAPEATLPDAMSSEADPAEVARLMGTLDMASPMSIMAFGRDVADRTAAYTDTLLSAARTSDLDGMGEQLNAIVVVAKDFNMSSLDAKWSRTPVVGGLLKKLVLTKERMLSRFETVKGQMDDLVDNVEKTSRTLEKRSVDFQTMYDGVRAEHASLAAHIAAIDHYIEQVDAQIAIVSTGDDMDGAERAAVLKGSRNALAKRSADLKILQHSALQTLPMIRVMQANNIALIDKFHVVRNLTLPAWKRAFLMALTLEEQKAAVGLANTIDDATNAFMKRNADLLHENSVATAKANQRMVIDVDTLRHVHEKVLETLMDVKAAHEAGAKRRDALSGELEGLRNEMTAGYQRIAGRDATLTASRG
ncbi:toxic anion resistance protein [Asticcacaulis sp. 201]|uniref:toxic anion resistance protein n=1 Tax=Asticcacaulis sp. 201 TaxID=3028787 RepID=UPI0029166386|nr:toxic anion resistance protein [Asticcacaulis sp. 201]MDV6330139.1 toxic anion resistance protein [Asticcacaulis sp. 201]